MPESRSSAIAAAVTTFANQVKADHQLGQRIAAGPEDQLKSTVKDLVKAIGAAIGRNVHVLSESPITDIGRPDLAIAVDSLLVGYIELKAPGVGTTQRDFRGTGHNLSQFKKFAALPNLIYTDARDWTFYINGVAQRAFNVRLGELDHTGASELTEDDVQKLLNLFREFLKWEPIVPRKPKELAKELAPLTRMLRTNVAEGANKPDSPLASIYDDWKRTLFRKPPPRSSPTRTRKHSPMDCCSPN